MEGFTVGVYTGRDTRIAVSGELDLAAVRRFEAACDSIAYSSVSRVVLDLRELVFIDATGLRAVLRLHATCLAEAVDLVIRPGARGVQRVFELTGTHRLLPFDFAKFQDRGGAPRTRKWRTSDPT